MCEMHLCSAGFCIADNVFIFCFSRMCTVWCAHICTGICADTWGTHAYLYTSMQSLDGCHQEPSSIALLLFIEAGSLSQTQRSNLAGFPNLNPLRLAIRVGWHNHPAVTWLLVLMTCVSNLWITFSKHYLVMILWDIKWPDTPKYDNDFIKKRTQISLNLSKMFTTALLVRVKTL